MASDEDYSAELGGNPTDHREQPTKICKRNGEHPSSPVRKGVHGPDDEGSSPSQVAKGAQKRGRGRPVIYGGDPDAPGLDPEVRRLLQRRISNRESARRTRERHQEQAAILHAKAESLHQKCKLLAAQVNSLKRKCSKLEALEKEMTEVQRARDEQTEAFKRTSDALQRVINQLTLRLHSKEQDMQPRMCLGADGCGHAINTQPATLQMADVLFTSGSESLSPIWSPFLPCESAAERIRNEGWPPHMNPVASRAANQVGCGQNQARSACTMSVHAPCEFVSPAACKPPQPLLTDVDMGTLEHSSLLDMMTEVGLLPNGQGLGIPTS